ARLLHVSVTSCIQARSDIPKPFASWDKYHGTNLVNPIDRQVVVPAVILRTVSDALSARARTLLWFIIPRVFQINDPFWSVNANFMERDGDPDRVNCSLTWSIRSSGSSLLRSLPACLDLLPIRRLRTGASSTATSRHHRRIGRPGLRSSNSTDPNTVTSATSAAPGSNRPITRRTTNCSWVPQRLPFPIYSDGLSKNTRMAHLKAS